MKTKSPLLSKKPTHQLALAIKRHSRHVNYADSSNNGNCSEVRFSGVTSSNILAFTGSGNVPDAITFLQFDAGGNRRVITNWNGFTFLGLDWARPVANSAGQSFTIENSFGNPELRKRDVAGSLLWSKTIQSTSTMAPDPAGGLYAAARPSDLSDYDQNGNLVWTLSLPAFCKEIVTDAQGNVFFMVENGLICRLAVFPTQPILTCTHNGLTSSGFRLSFTGVPQVTSHIQGSTDLINWADLGTVTNTSGEAQFIDPAATNMPFRYYRVVSP